MLRRLFLVLPLALTFLLGAPALEGGSGGVAEAQRVTRAKKSRTTKSKARKKARRRTVKRARTRSLRTKRPAARRGAKRARAKKNPLRRAAGAARQKSKATRQAVKRGARRAGRALKRGGKRAARASWRLAKRAGRAAKNGARLHLGKRAPVRRNIGEARKAMKEGSAKDAAHHLTKAQLRKADGTFIKSDRGKGSNRRLGARERFALWRARFAVKRKSRKLLDSKAKEGDLAGLKDAVASLNAFEANGHMGAYARYKVGAAKRESFRKTALTLTAKGDFAGAREAMGKALELTGKRNALGRFAEGFKNRKAARKIFDQAMAMSKHYSKKGRPDLLAQTSQFAAQIAVSTGLRWRARKLKRKAPRMMKKANRRLVGTYLKQARKLHRSGNNTEAAYTYLAAKEVKVKRSWRQRRLEKKLERNLGEHLDGKSLQDLQQMAGANGEMNGGPRMPDASRGAPKMKEPEMVGPAANAGAGAAAGGP